MNTETLKPSFNGEAYRHQFERGISYSEYMQNMNNEIVNNVEHQHSDRIPLNLQRSKRITRTLQIQNEVTDALKKLNQKFHWLVISEHWCGDSSQLLPVINAIAEASHGKIELRIVYRDENPDLMNVHLTNGSKSIPKLIQLDPSFIVTGEWGPRPQQAQQLVTQLKSNPETAPTYGERLHKWYADDKSISTQHELLELIFRTTTKLN